MAISDPQIKLANKYKRLCLQPIALKQKSIQRIEISAKAVHSTHLLVNSLCHATHGTLHLVIDKWLHISIRLYFCCQYSILQNLQCWKSEKNPKSKSGLLQIELTVSRFEAYLSGNFTKIRPQLGKVISVKTSQQTNEANRQTATKNITFLAEITNTLEKQGLSVDLTQQ